MIYLLDTTALSDLIREHSKVIAHLAALTPNDRVNICATVRGEIRYGIERLPPGKRRTEIETKANNLLAVLPCQSISDRVADLYGSLKASTQEKGLSLDENDLWIASAALSLEATLVSRDSDFHRVDGLSITDWTK